MGVRCRPSFSAIIVSIAALLALETVEVDDVELLYSDSSTGAVLVHLGVGVVGVVGHFDLGHIGQTHVADAVDIAEHHAFQLVRVGKGITDLDDVAVVVAVAALDVRRGIEKFCA